MKTSLKNWQFHIRYVLGTSPTVIRGNVGAIDTRTFESCLATARYLVSLGMNIGLILKLVRITRPRVISSDARNRGAELGAQSESSSVPRT